MLLLLQTRERGQDRTDCDYDKRTHSRVDISLTHQINLHNFVYQYFYSDHHCRYLVTDKAALYNIYNHTITVYTYWHLHYQRVSSKTFISTKSCNLSIINYIIRLKTVTHKVTKYKYKVNETMFKARFSICPLLPSCLEHNTHIDRYI